MRVKSKFHNKTREKSIEEIAGVVAFNAWRIAQDTVNKMYNDGFNFRSNEQILDVIGELAAFFVLMADRWVGDRLDDEQRQRFTNTLALKMVDTMHDNRVEEQGPGEYRQAFVERLNARLADYSEFNVVDGQPSYPLLRLFGTHVDSHMGGEENKWVLEQVMEVETPAALKKLKRAVEGPFS